MTRVITKYLGFWLALAACVVLTFMCFVGFAALVKKFGIMLM